MRISCPYCEKTFTVYPIPTRQAIRHRRAGFVALAAKMVAAFLVCFALGPEVIGSVADLLMRHLTPRIAIGLAAALVGIPFLFVGLAVYDRTVPHFGPPMPDEPRCPDCDNIPTPDSTG
jgi:hypothetical protein